MAFQLRIAEGKEAGREFTFEQGEVLIGRTEECDVVLYDPGISRRHCRFFAEAGTYFVEDMGSSNGTQVNGTPVKRQELVDGDSVNLGGVVFSFTTVADEDPITDGAGNSSLDASTRIVASAEMVKPKGARKMALVPADADSRELDRLSKRNTHMMPAVKRPVALAKLAPDEVETSAPRKSLVRRVRRDEPAAETQGPLTAADRARIRRQSGPVVGGARIFWADASTTGRALAATGAGVLVLGALAVLIWAVMPDDSHKPPPEPTELSGSPVEDSFGLGPGVTYAQPDRKTFLYQFNTPAKQAIVLVRFQSRDIGDKEVMLSVNGADVEMLKADGTDQDEKVYEIKVPAQYLDKTKPNKIVFDNIKNPPGEDPWRIWNVWVEMATIPEVPLEQLIAEANRSYQRGNRSWEQRQIGAENTYKAYSDFRQAWLLLEGLPGEKPELYALTRDKMRDAQKELNKRCASLMLDALTYVNQNKGDKARAALEEVKRYFPRNDQPCPRQAAIFRITHDL